MNLDKIKDTNIDPYAYDIIKEEVVPKLYEGENIIFANTTRKGNEKKYIIFSYLTLSYIILLIILGITRFFVVDPFAITVLTIFYIIFMPIGLYLMYRVFVKSEDYDINDQQDYIENNNILCFTENRVFCTLGSSGKEILADRKLDTRLFDIQGSQTMVEVEYDDIEAFEKQKRAFNNFYNTETFGVKLEDEGTTRRWITDEDHRELWDFLKSKFPRNKLVSRDPSTGYKITCRIERLFSRN